MALLARDPHAQKQHPPPPAPRLCPNHKQTDTMPNIQDLNDLHTADPITALVEAMLDRGILDKLNLKESLEYASAVVHETAHLVACAACRGSSIGGVHVPLTKKRIGQGLFDGAELAQDESHFVTLAGYAIEELMAEGGTVPVGGSVDYQQGYRKGYEWVLDEARAFVKDHEALIFKTACGIVLMARRDGSLTSGPRFHRLVQWVRGQVRPFKSRDSAALRALGTRGCK